MEAILIKLVILDVDGVLTTGKKYYNREGEVKLKSFCDKDWTAIKRFQAIGIPVIFITGDPYNKQILDNAYGILGIEFMAAAQALDFREYQFGKGVETAKKVIRKYVEFLDVDRPLFSDHTRMKELVESCEILNEVEKVIGSLE